MFSPFRGGTADLIDAAAQVELGETIENVHFGIAAN